MPSSDVEYPGQRPSTLARESEEAGLAAFSSAKRCFFFFWKGHRRRSNAESKLP